MASGKSRRPAAKPVTYTRRMADEICNRLATGESLRSICRDPHMPDEKAVRLWVIARADTFAPQFTRARELGFQSIAEEVIEISDADYTLPDGTVDNGSVQQARLRSDNRKWFLSKMMPRQFGDRVTQEITGEDGGALISRIELIPVPARPRQEDLSADGGEAGEVRRFPPRLADRRSG